MSVKNGVNGWAGSILRINLTTGEIRTEDTLPKYKPFLGGMGIGYKVMMDEVPMTTKAYDEANKIIFGVGPLTASGVPCSGRTNITSLSAWSKGYSIIDSHMGGHFAHNLKYAGYDAVVIEGKSEKPVYIKIDDEKVSIEDASHVWGKGTFETNKTLTKEAGPEFDVCSIGRAGENMIPLSTIITSVGNSGGGGMASVLGSKHVKALVCRGTGAVKIARPRELKLLSDHMLREIIGSNNNNNVPMVPQSWAEFTSNRKNRWYGAPGRVWGKAPNGPIDTGEQPVGDTNKLAMRCLLGVWEFGDIAQKYIVKQGGCSSCPIRCYAELEMEPLADYDLPTHFSNACLPMNHEGIYPGVTLADYKEEGDGKMIRGGAGSRVMDDLGVDFNYGNLQRDFTRLYQEGILREHMTDEEWNAVPWDLMESGDPRWVITFWNLIADGKGVWGELGKGSYYLYHAWGLDDPSKNSAGSNYFDDIDANNQNVSYNGYPKHHSSEDCWQSGLLYNVMYNRDCMIHAMTNFVRSGSPFNEVIKPVLESYFGEGCVDAPKNYTPINANKVKLAKWAFLRKQWHDSATLCDWMYPMTLSPNKKRGYKGDLDLDAKFMSAITGEDWTTDDIMFSCERISHVLRGLTAISFAVNENSKNLREDHDRVPAWVFDKDPDIPVFTEGTDKLDREDMELAKTMFYEAMGWNTETGIPTRETLEKFDLGDLAAKMDEYGLL